MSRTRRTSNKRKHELENEKPTRKSARLHNLRSDYLQSKTLGKTKTTKFQRNVKTCPVFTRGRGRFVDHDIYCSKPEESTITNENNDSDGNCKRTLTYSSSDSNASKSNPSKSSKEVLRNSFDQRVLRKRKVNDGQNSEKERTETSNSVVLGSVTNQNGYKLRRSPRVAESGSETSNVGEEKIIAKKAQKTKLKDGQTSEKERTETSNSVVLRSVTNQNGYNLRRRGPRVAESVGETLNVGEEKTIAMKAQKAKLTKKKNENVKKHPGVDMHRSKPQALNQFAWTPSSLSRDQVEKDGKKPKVKKKGTLARKRELRAMLEKQDEGYEDDAFEGTPFRNRKPLLKCKLSPVVLDTSIQSICADIEFKTSCSKTPVNRLRPAGPLSSGTSESDIMTPGLLNSVNRNYIDCYVNQLKRRKIHLGCNKKMRSHTPLSKKPCRIIQSKSFDFDSNSTVQKSTTESENCEEDYYWSDVE